MASLRGSDTVARLGGDEFAILFPATSTDGIERAMRKLRAALSHGLRLEGREAIHVSVGYAIAQSGEMSLDDLLKTADANMYRRKRRRSQQVEERRVRNSHADGNERRAIDLRGVARRDAGRSRPSGDSG
jgi:diguanylate cyclase (GGDEF)-like protein